MRDESTQDVLEWVQYHRWLGIDHVYLTENHSKVSMRPALRDFIESGFVTFHTEVQPHAQILVYKRCLMHRRGSHDWLAFIDIDEYLAVREKGKNLKGILNDYRHFPGLALHWIFFGANNRTSRPPQGGVLRDYTSCNPEPQSHVKTIVNSFFAADIAVHPHNFRFRGQAVPVNDAKFPVANRYGIGHHCMGNAGHPHCFLTVGYDVEALHERSVNRLAVFHYVTKSLEDFQIKAQRGGGTRPIGKTKQFYDSIQRCRTTRSDAAICSELAQVADACCPRPARL